MNYDRLSLNQIKIYRTQFFIWLFAVLVLSVLPSDALNLHGTEKFDPRGYWQHALAYGIGMFLMNFSNLFDEKWKSVGFVIFLGILFEMIQIWLPCRSFNVVDILANFSGIILFFCGLFIFGSDDAFMRKGIVKNKRRTTESEQRI